MGEKSAQFLDPKGCSELCATRPDAVVIDVMLAARYARCHIPGALNACVYEVVFADTVAGLVSGKDTPVVLYGAGVTPHDGAHAADKLLRLGYGNVFVLDGGLAAWALAGFPVEGANPDAAATPPAELVVPDGDYRVDPAACLIEWTGRNAANKHHGTVGLAEGCLRAADGVLSGEFAVDLGTIRCINLEGSDLHPVLIGHLQSDDFFFTALYPKAVFTIERATPMIPANLSAPNYLIEGWLTLRGVTRELAFAATVSLPDEGGLGVEAHFDFDRTLWGAIYGSSRFFHFLGMHLVYDPVSIGVRIRAV